MKANYAKPWMDFPDQLAKLEAKGLHVGDRAEALEFLSYVNYYRFSRFCLPFQTVSAQSPKRRFVQGTDFADVKALCVLDRELRDAFSDGLEMIEISLRSCIAHWFAKAHGPFGHADIRNFDRSAKWPFHGQTDSRYDNWHDKVLSETKRSKETFVLHFEATYAEYPELPLWAVAELCSFGSLSMMYSFMQKPDMNAIAAQYKLQSVFLESWLHTFSYLRNLCAHHARLWDKRMSIRPKVPVGKAWEAVRHNPSNVFFAALMVNWMLSHDSFDPDFHAKWKREIEGIADRLHGRFPQFRAITGFSDGWKRNPIWSL